MTAYPKRYAIVFFNLGGPSDLDAVKPFLFNLFSDPSILSLPQPFRYLGATLISHLRVKEAQKIYKYLGGSSPLLANTLAQQAALQKVLEMSSEASSETFQVFTAMRYWHPFIQETVKEVIKFQPHQIVLLPLYPQYSSTTTASSYKEWQRHSMIQGLKVPSQLVCCYPTLSGFIQGISDLLKDSLKELRQEIEENRKIRVLFSAHGLPLKIIEKGDPYQYQMEQTKAAVIDYIKDPDIETQLCFQSRVGPLKWLEPSTEEEIIKAGQDNRAVILVPISFVSEHSETLYELDHQYANLAQQSKVPHFKRVAAVSLNKKFIEGLAQLVRDALKIPIEKKCIAKDLCPNKYILCGNKVL